MRPDVGAGDYAYKLKEGQAKWQNKVHAVEHVRDGEHDGRLYPLTLCGVLHSAGWQDVTIGEVGLDGKKLCGTCDKAIRHRVKVAREAEALAQLREVGETQGARILHELIVAMANVEGMIGGLRQAVDHTAQEMDRVVQRMVAILYPAQEGEEGEEEGGPHAAQPAPDRPS